MANATSGDWTPHKRIGNAPLFDWPVKPLESLKWLVGMPRYQLPWNAIHVLISLGCRAYLTPGHT